jgi:hypothetical protein
MSRVDADMYMDDQSPFGVVFAKRVRCKQWSSEGCLCVACTSARLGLQGRTVHPGGDLAPRLERNPFTVYRATGGTLAGRYVLADFGRDRDRHQERYSERVDATQPLLSPGRPISSFGEARGRELLVVGFGGAVLRLLPGSRTGTSTVSVGWVHRYTCSAIVISVPLAVYKRR